MLRLLLLWVCLSSINCHKFEELCDTPTVVFKNNDARTCVCFPPGLYEMRVCNNDTVEYISMNEHSCVKLPYGIISVSLTTEKKQATIALDLCGPQKKRVKRQAAPYDPKAFYDTLDDNDEDKKSIGLEIGNELMIKQINAYVERVIERLTGINEEGAGQSAAASKAHLPAIRLLDFAKQIMVKTCTVVSPDFFDMAFSAFVNLQMEHYQLKEPYIPFTSLKRIEQAMQQCLEAARPHLFFDNITSSISNTEECYNHLPSSASNYTILYPGTDKEENRSLEIPVYGSSILNETAIAEPLIETVWKMLVNAHSYCFKYFEGSFNDHHVFTVALLPMFTNQIQDLWLSSGIVYDDTKTEHETNILYGGLFGNVPRVRKIAANVDLCVGASKAVSQYPWFMNRPLRDHDNKWRKKRSVLSSQVEVKHQHAIQFQCINDHVQACSTQ